MKRFFDKEYAVATIPFALLAIICAGILIGVFVAVPLGNTAVATFKTIYNASSSIAEKIPEPKETSSFILQSFEAFAENYGTGAMLIVIVIFLACIPILWKLTRKVLS